MQEYRFKILHIPEAKKMLLQIFYQDFISKFVFVVEIIKVIIYLSGEVRDKSPILLCDY